MNIKCKTCGKECFESEGMSTVFYCVVCNKSVGENGE